VVIVGSAHGELNFQLVEPGADRFDVALDLRLEIRITTGELGKPGQILDLRRQAVPRFHARAEPAQVAHHPLGALSIFPETGRKAPLLEVLYFALITREVKDAPQSGQAAA
jgi:hypothetical protein